MLILFGAHVYQSINMEAALRFSLPVSARVSALHPEYVEPWRRSLRRPRLIPRSKEGSIETYDMVTVDPMYIDRGLRAWIAGRSRDAIAILKEGFFNEGEEASDGRFTLVWVLMFDGQTEEAFRWAATGVDVSANEIMQTTLAVLLAERGEATPDTILYARGQIARMNRSGRFDELPLNEDFQSNLITTWFALASTFSLTMGMDIFEIPAWKRVLQLDPGNPIAAINVGLLETPATANEKREVATMVKLAMTRASHGRSYRRLWEILYRVDKPAALAMPNPRDRP